MIFRKDISNEKIVELYFNQNLNRRQTAQALNCSEDLISYRLKKIGLKPKSMSENVIASKKHNIKMNNNIKDLIFGELLGDGSLISNKTRTQASFRESFGYNKLEWAQWMFNWFVENKIPLNKKIYMRKPCGKSPNVSFSFSSKFIQEFSHIHKQWYNVNENYNNKEISTWNNRKYIKKVPQNLKLNLKILLHWYIGDGTRCSNGCVLHTECFSKEEINFLIFRLKKDLGILSNHMKKNTIYITAKSTRNMLEMMQCPVDCYKYKWNVTV